MHSNGSGGRKPSVFDCPICERTYNRKDNLKAHMKMSHKENLTNSEGTAEFKCSHCNIDFILQENLDVHIEKKHMDFSPDGFMLWPHTVKRIFVG